MKSQCSKARCMVEGIKAMMKLSWYDTDKLNRSKAVPKGKRKGTKQIQAEDDTATDIDVDSDYIVMKLKVKRKVRILITTHVMKNKLQLAASNQPMSMEIHWIMIMLKLVCGWLYFMKRKGLLERFSTSREAKSTFDV